MYASYQSLVMGTSIDHFMYLYIREQMYRYRVEYLKDVESRKTLVEEHYAVYRALKARNQQQAVKDICIHIVNQQNAILRSLEQMNKEEQEK